MSELVLSLRIGMDRAGGGASCRSQAAAASVNNLFLRRCLLSIAAGSNMQEQLRALEERRARETQSLEHERKMLGDKKKQVTKDLKNKKKREDRIMNKASKNLSAEQILGVAARKLAKEERRSQRS